MASTTLTALEKLESAGFNRTQATAIVATFEDADSEQAGTLATKADLHAGLADLRAGLADLRADLYRALWLLGGSIVAAVAGLLAIVQVVAGRVGT